jgi:DNA-directed RNA polymerase subunit L
MPKKKMVPKDEAEKEIVRVAFRFHGPELEQIREIRDMLNLNSEVDAARYLMQRGLEAMTPTLMSRRVQVQMAKQANPEEILKKLAEQGIYEAPPKVYVEPPK